MRRGKMRGGKIREGKMCGGKMRGGKMCEGKMCEGKREWNCGGIYGMMGIGMSCVACSSYGIRRIAYKIA